MVRNDFAEPCDDHGFILVNDKQQRSPFKRSQNEEKPRIVITRLCKIAQSPTRRPARSNIDHVHELSIPGHLKRQRLKNVLQAVIDDDFLCRFGRMLALPRDKDGAASPPGFAILASNNENFCASPFASFTRRNAYASACFSRSFAWPARSEQHRCTRPCLVIAVCFSVAPD